MNADADTLGTDAENETAHTCAGWPVGNGHEQHLSQALEYINDVIRRAQTLYDHCDGRAEPLTADGATAALDESEALRSRLARAGETVEDTADAAPGLAALDEDEIDDCTEYYADVRSVNDSLRKAWEQFNDVVGAAEAMNGPSSWGQTTDTDAFADSVAEARTHLWRAQAQIEQLLLSRFGYEETDFERPADDLDWS